MPPRAPVVEADVGKRHGCYFNCVEIEENVVLSSKSMPLTVVTIARAMPPAMRLYSIAAAAVLRKAFNFRTIPELSDNGLIDGKGACPKAKRKGPKRRVCHLGIAATDRSAGNAAVSGD